MTISIWCCLANAYFKINEINVFSNIQLSIYTLHQTMLHEDAISAN